MSLVCVCVCGLGRSFVKLTQVAVALPKSAARVNLGVRGPGWSIFLSNAWGRPEGRINEVRQDEAALDEAS